MRSSVFQSAPATPTPPMHSPSTITGQPPSMAVQRSAPAASASPSAWLVSRSCPTAPLAEVGRLLEAAQTALVVAEWTVWKRPPSMRSSTIRCPPASATAIDTATPACCAVTIAAVIIVLAPALVRRLLSAMFMDGVPPARWQQDKQRRLRRHQGYRFVELAHVLCRRTGVHFAGTCASVGPGVWSRAGAPPRPARH